MIILITSVRSAELPNLNADLVTFDVVQGSPTLFDIENLFNIELNNTLCLTYSESKKKGQFFDIDKECIRGMHFNSQEHYKLECH